MTAILAVRPPLGDTVANQAASVHKANASITLQPSESSEEFREVHHSSESSEEFREVHHSSEDELSVYKQPDALCLYSQNNELNGNCASVSTDCLVDMIPDSRPPSTPPHPRPLDVSDGESVSPASSLSVETSKLEVMLQGSECHTCHGAEIDVKVEKTSISPKEPKKKKHVTPLQAKREYSLVIFCGVCLAFNAGYVNGVCLSGMMAEGDSSPSADGTFTS